MRVIEGRDVNELYWRGMNMLQVEGREEASRAGAVKVFPEPVTSTYKTPRQRVLLDKDRKANPFFHLFESLWMLAGRDDVASLNRYITDFGTRFAETSGEVHGAYGHRWRTALGFDQLESIIEKLKKNPRDRQCVLQMWDARQTFGCNDLNGEWKDRPCNTHVYFRVRDEVGVSYLDMLVSCRSNDIIYGAYGANAVHFSILMEYMAGRLNCAMGTMEQVSFNYHAYMVTLAGVGVPRNLETYEGRGISSIPMGSAWDKWDADLTEFFLWHRNLVERGEHTMRTYANSWFAHTATPMFLAHFKWKSAFKEEARRIAQNIDAPDWRYACLQWMDQRTEARSR